MKMSRKLTEALREAHIDFTTFDIVDIAPQKDGHTVVILAAKKVEHNLPRFNVQYRDHSLWYYDLRRLMDICVEEKLYTRLAADRLLYFYNESLREIRRIFIMMHTTEYNRNFWNAMRRGAQGDIALIPREGRHIMTGTFQLPAESGRKYIAKLEKASLFRQLATVVKAEQNDSHIWTFDSDDMADWVGDRPVDVRAGIDDFTGYETNVHKLAAMTRLGDDFTSDLKFDIEDYLTTVFAKKFAKAEDNAFINGDSVDKPVGILHSEGGAEIGAAAATLTFDDITKLFFSVKPEYRMGGSWLMNDETALYLRNLKDDAGSYLWRGNADMLLGKPVVISNEMPSIGKGAKPVAFGDFSYYWIISRFPMTVKVLKEVFALHGQNGYLAYEFLDGRLIRPEAIKVIQMAE